MPDFLNSPCSTADPHASHLWMSPPTPQEPIAYLVRCPGIREPEPKDSYQEGWRDGLAAARIAAADALMRATSERDRLRRQRDMLLAIEGVQIGEERWVVAKAIRHFFNVDPDEIEEPKPEPLHVQVVQPGDRLVLVWPDSTDHEQLAANAAAGKERWPDVPILHVAGVVELAVLKAGEHRPDEALDLESRVTQWAYDQTVKALKQHRARANRAEARLGHIADALRDVKGGTLDMASFVDAADASLNHTPDDTAPAGAATGYCTGCGAEFRSANLWKCPDCDWPYCVQACQAEHTKLGTCPITAGAATGDGDE